MKALGIPGSERSDRDLVRESVERLDLAELRTRMHELVNGGQRTAVLFAELLRPGLREALERWPQGANGARGRAAIAAISQLVGDLARGEQGESTGAGRRAAVICDPDPLGTLDGQVLAELMEGEGWVVSELTSERLDAARMLAELQPWAIVLTGEREAAEALAAPAAALPHSPFLAFCSFEDRPAAPAVAPLELLRRLSGELSDAGPVAWGLGLRRRGQTLYVTLTGHLDIDAARRLEEVVASRADTFTALDLDLLKVSSAADGVLAAIVGRAHERGWNVHRLRLAS